MKITMYELLGLVKDGKAPNKIKFKNNIYKWIERNNNVFNYKQEYNGKLIDNYLCDDWFMDSESILNDKVEILEEKKKIPKKLEDRARFQYSQIPTWLEKKEIIKTINENFEKHQKAIYELIDYLKSKGE